MSLSIDVIIVLLGGPCAGPSDIVTKNRGKNFLQEESTQETDAKHFSQPWQCGSRCALLFLLQPASSLQSSCTCHYAFLPSSKLLCCVRRLSAGPPPQCRRGVCSPRTHGAEAEPDSRWCLRQLARKGRVRRAQQEGRPLTHARMRAVHTEDDTAPMCSRRRASLRSTRTCWSALVRALARVLSGASRHLRGCFFQKSTQTCWSARAPALARALSGASRHPRGCCFRTPSGMPRRAILLRWV